MWLAIRAYFAKIQILTLGNVKERAPDEVLDTSFLWQWLVKLILTDQGAYLSGVGHCLSLLHLYICALTLPIIGYSVDSICTSHSRLQGCWIVQICLGNIASAGLWT